MAEPTPAAPRPGALAFLKNLDAGQLVNQLDDELSDLVAALQARARDVGGKPKGRLTIALNFVLDNGVVEVVPAVDVKLPKPVRGKTIMWPTADNRLTPQNPRQTEIDFRDVSTAATPLRKVD